MSGHPYKGKRSRWISCQTPPVEPGLYLGRCPNFDNEEFWALYDPLRQEWFCSHIDGFGDAAKSNQYCCEWRGLAEEPK